MKDVLLELTDDLPEDKTSLLNTEEVARALRISRSYAYLLMKRGEIPSVRFGKAVRVRREDLQRYIEQRARLERAAFEERRPA